MLVTCLILILLYLPYLSIVGGIKPPQNVGGMLEMSSRSFSIDDMKAERFRIETTRKQRDTEAVMRRSEGAIGKVPALVTR